MKPTQFTSKDLKRIVKLLEAREALEGKVAAIDAELAAYEPGGPARPVKPARGRVAQSRARRPAKGKRAKRGAVTAAILELVKRGGASGVTVREIAAKMGLGYNRIFTWFYKTGKKHRQIEKIGEATYRWLG